jgi:hypothetical protein
MEYDDPLVWKEGALLVLGTDLQIYQPAVGVGDSPRGPLKQRGNPHLKPTTKPKHSVPNHAGCGPCRRDPDGPPRRPS